jgi:hypothetical protein
VGEIQEFTVHDRLGPLTLKGKALAVFMEGRDDKPRWTDMALYRIIDTDTPYRYGLEITARSYVYHRPSARCAKPHHKRTTVGDVRQSDNRWRNLFPCERCNPPELERMNDINRISEERDDPHFYVCIDPADIIAKLYQRNGEISEMAAKLLRKAAHEEPEIAKAWKVPDRRVPAWGAGGPQNIDVWLRGRIPEDERLAFYRWIADTTAKMT